MTAIPGNANNNTLAKLLTKTWVVLQLPTSVTMSQQYQIGSRVYRPFRSQRLLAVQSTDVSSLVTQGWQVVVAADGVSGGGEPPTYPTYPALQNLLNIGWVLLREGGLDGSALG